MRFWIVLRSGLTRRPLRKILSVLSIFVAFFLFGLLASVKAGFEGGVEVSGADRLITTHRLSITQFLPEAHLPDIAAVEGVTGVTHATWFGGVYQDPANFFLQLVVNEDTFLELHPEYVVSEADRGAWLSNQRGALVGRDLARRFGWKKGDRIPLEGAIWINRDTENLWEFDVEGLFDPAEPGVDTSLMLVRYGYFNDARTWGRGYVGWYLARISDADRAAEIGDRIDRQFANSFFETKTVPERAFLQSLANQVGDLGKITLATLAVVFFTMLMVVGNAMAQSWRERIRELGVLQAIGFSDLAVGLLVVAESLVLSVIGGGLGLLLAWNFASAGDPTGGLLPGFHLSAGALAAGLLLVVLTGALAGLYPFLAVNRMRPAEALRSLPT